MGQLAKGKGYVRITVTPEQVLHWTNHGADLTDSLRSEAWKMLVLHDPQLYAHKKFTYGDVSVIDGLFSIVFFEDIPEGLIPSPPGP